MIKKLIGIFIIILFIGTTVSQVSACTGFTVSEDDAILVGANHDWPHNFNVYMHTFPAMEEKYGRVIFEFNFPLVIDTFPYYLPDYIVPKQGMNDQGLYFDLLWAPELIPVNSSDKPSFDSNDPDYYRYAIWAYCLAKCSNVSEVLEVFNQYNLEGMSFFQAFFVDKYGDSVIIEGDDIVYREGDFQVVTNFLQSQPELGGYPCWRYETAVSMIENMTDFSDEYFRSICNATHQGHTVFSNVYDLTQGIFYVNYYKNYDKTLEFNLNEELAKGELNVNLGSLFEPEDNQPPEKPSTPTGETSGKPRVEYDYRATEPTDPNGDDMMMLFDWGDGSDSGWIMPSASGRIKTTHKYTKQGTYEIKVKAIDIYGKESEWSDPLSVSMPKNKPIIYRSILNFLQQHPNLFPILRQLLQ
jgi:choloylglycine hydrolase